MEPYSYEVNFKKKRITLHFESRNDFVIDCKNVSQYINKDVSKNMPKKNEIDKLVLNSITEEEKRIDQLNFKSEKLLIMKRNLKNNDNKKKIKRSIINNLENNLRKSLSENFMNKQIERCCNREWLTDILKLVKR